MKITVPCPRRSRMTAALVLLAMPACGTKLSGGTRDAAPSTPADASATGDATGAADGGPTGAADASVPDLSDPTVANGRGYQWDILRTGEVQYLDRASVFYAVPEAYQGMYYLKASNDDKQLTDTPFVTFELGLATTVHVAHDDRISGKPGWLSSWTDTGDDLQSNDATFSLYARDYPAGHVALGGNGGDGNSSMYTAVVAVDSGYPSPQPNPTTRFDVTAYGATGDGSTLDSPAINTAIAAASAAGGGVVYFPPGTYRSGSIILKDNVTLYLHKQAVIKASLGRDYSSVDPNPWDAYQDWGHSHWKSALIWGIGVSNVGITGPGLIDGSNSAGDSGLTAGDPADGYGDRAISMKDVTGVVIKDVAIHRAGHFGIIITGGTDITIDNILIDTNRDGINIDACSGVSITNTVVNSPADDAIVLKSSYALGYLRATEDVLIDNCTVIGNSVGSLFPQFPNGTEAWKAGRIKFGTESNGGFKNITITNSHFQDCNGFMLATVDGGPIENIVIDDIRMYNLVSEPIFLRLGNRARGPGPPPPGTIRNVSFSNLYANADHPGVANIISGIPGHLIENVTMTNVQVDFPGGRSASDANLVLDENEAGHPDAFMFGQVTPAYGVYLRHVDGASFANCRFDVDSPDGRPKFKLVDALNVTGAQ